MKRKIYIAGLILTLTTFAQGQIHSMADVNRYGGLEARISDIGGGFGAFYQFAPLTNLQLLINLHWLSITAGEVTLYDNYGYPHKVNEVSLDFLKSGLGLKYHLFRGELANAFSPFLMVQAGAVLAMDTPEYSSFKNKIKNITSYGGYSGGIYGGIDFKAGGGYGFSVAAGYEINAFYQTIDGRSMWDGLSLVLQYGRIR
ncbi:MAG TPA: hypothetical protein ENN84_04165 [Candidatus Marinimicrobia bacterium]|nr:hypothetical protein [Candidatus Neomarinimicrobiota bacterium]